MRIECYRVGRGIHPKDKDLIGIDFDPFHKESIMFWGGDDFHSRFGGSIQPSEIDRFLWAFECTNTMWFYDFLKQFPSDQPLTLEVVNAEYVKHYGKDMILSED